MFFKKNKNPAENISPQIPQEEVNKIRVMPPRFVVEEKKSGHGFLILIILLIVLATLVVGAAFLVLQTRQKEAVQQNIDIPANINANTAAEGANVNSANTNVNPAINSEPTPTPSPNTNTNTAVETNTNVVTPPPSEFLVDTSDIDTDKLTGEEEKLFSTNANNSDTDSDGYSDYNELLTGYDPRQTGKTLLESGLVQEYVLEGNAKIIYPSKWLAKFVGQLVIFDTKRGDSISIAYSQNTDKLEPQDWILENDIISVTQSQITQANLINKAIAYKTNDNLEYFVFSSDFSRVYIFTYRPSIISSIPFLSTFDMMIQSIRL